MMRCSFALTLVLLVTGANANNLFSRGRDRHADMLTWKTVVNNADAIPGNEDKTFSSYNAPSVNTDGFVVFRARSTG